MTPRRVPCQRCDGAGEVLADRERPSSPCPAGCRKGMVLSVSRERVQQLMEAYALRMDLPLPTEDEVDRRLLVFSMGYGRDPEA